jgi:hypothetical protein
VIGPLLGVVVLIAVVVFYRRRRGLGAADAAPTLPKRNCQWVATGDPDRRLREYRCETCGVTGYSATGNPPVECKQGLK